MFLAQLPATAPPADPRGIPFARRLAALLAGRPRIAWFYERPDTSTFRYRVANMIEALPTAAAGAAGAWFCLQDLPRMPEVIGEADLLVLCRTRYSEGVADMVARARARGLRILFDCDDLVFDDRFVQLVLETLDQEVNEAAWDHWFAYFARMGAALRLCDGGIATNEVLAARMRDFAGFPVAVVPNFLNGAQQRLSAQILAAKQRSGFARDGRVHLGYFSGTPTHNRDFALAAGALRDLLERDERLVLRLVGFLEPGPAFARFGARVERHPLQDPLNLQRLIGSTEVNLVPLQDNAFTNCKSELKVFEAAAVGTLSVASPGFTLARAIEEGRTGFLTPAQGWGAAIGRALEALPRYPGMAMAAAEAALDRFGPARQGPAIGRALGLG
jgi:glycosyltransferase involved in cell wall biosynthesis